MEIKKSKYEEIETEFSNIKPDLLDRNATYFGCYIKNDLVGIVSYIEHDYTVYLCHSYVKEEYRNMGIYKLLWEYRDSKIKSLNKPIYAHCNVDSLKYFINNGYFIEKALFKVVKK